MATLTDQPGWRPDPDQKGSMRWWNGVDWSDARRKADRTMDRVRDEARTAARGSTISAQQVAQTTADSSRAQSIAAATASGTVGATNPLAVAALAIGAVALGFGLYGVLPFLAFVLSIWGLIRGRRLEKQGVQQTGFGQSLAALLLSIIGLAQWVPFFLTLIPGLPGVAPSMGPTPLPTGNA